ncbi:MAG TPA: phosphatase PAP2 family protein [Gemmatimonadaceae bacterium]|nr:phosphatase PAP2 family protein [Gemmatimonadaceae bacterium]
MMSRMRALSVLLIVVAPRLGAQQAPADSTSRGPLVNSTAAWIAGGTIVGTAALMLADPGITEEFRDPGPQRSHFLRSAASGFDWVGDPGTVILAATMYGTGRLTHHPVVAELGLRSAEALLISSTVTGVLKGVVGRDRPYLNNRDADDFHAGAGFGGAGHTSFPSGHATAAFAVASVVASESSFRWPHASHVVKPVVYGLATSVALARVYGEHHWASDVVAGAGIGTLTGLGVVRYHRLHPHSRLDRWLLDARVTPAVGNGGVGMFVSIATR